jgi:hypothetical protein
MGAKVGFLGKLKMKNEELKSVLHMKRGRNRKKGLFLFFEKL